MWRFNPFGFLIEDSYSPFARSLRTSLWDKTVDTFRVFCGSALIEPIDAELFSGDPHSASITLGVFDYVTFSLFRSLTTLGWYVFNRYMQYYCYDSDGDRMLNENHIKSGFGRDTFEICTIVCAGILVIIRLAFAIIMTAVCFPFIALTQWLSSRGETLKQEINPLFSSYRFKVDLENIKVVKIEKEGPNRINVITCMIYNNYYTDNFGVDGTMKFQFDIADFEGNDSPAWKAFRELNIGGINEMIRRNEVELSPRMQAASKMQLSAEIIAQGIRTKTSYFQNVPTDIIVNRILLEAYKAELNTGSDDLVDMPELEGVSKEMFVSQKLLLNQTLENAHANQVPHDNDYHQWKEKQTADDVMCTFKLFLERRLKQQQTTPIVEELSDDEVDDFDARLRAHMKKL